LHLSGVGDVGWGEDSGFAETGAGFQVGDDDAPPFSTIIRADAAPRPEAPPVTKAVLPSIRMGAV
jgi:hypothetical protein